MVSGVGRISHGLILAVGDGLEIELDMLDEGVESGCGCRWLLDVLHPFPLICRGLECG